MTTLRHAMTFDYGGGSGGGRSQVDALNDAAQRLVDTDVERAHELTVQARIQAQRINYTTGFARAMLIQGLAESGRGQYEAASDALREAAALYKQLEDYLGEVEALSALGKLHLDYGKPGLAEEVLVVALELTRTPDLPSQRATVLNRLSGALHARGAYQEALEALQQVLELRRGLGDKAGEASCLNNLGTSFMSLGRYPEALDVLITSYSIYRDEVDDVRTQSRTVINLGQLYLFMNDYDKALKYYNEAVVLGKQCGDRLVEAVALLNIGNAQQESGLDEDAIVTLRAARRLCQEIEYQPGEISALDGIAQIQERRGRIDDAMSLHRTALDLARSIEDVEGQLDALHQLGRLEVRRGDIAEALAHLHEGLTLGESIDRKRSVRDLHEVIADAHKSSGNFELALTHFEAYHRVERELFNEESERKTRALSVQFDVERARHEAEVYRLRTETEQRAREEAEALVRARTADLERAQLEIVTRLAMAAEFRDDATGEHTWRVGLNAALIGRELGLAPYDVEVLQIAARLHDVGKIGISDALLLKPGKLTETEFETMKTHTLIGARLLSGGQSDVLRMAELIALTHHERFDGTGYPHGLAGEAIPLVGRIVAVADVFDALRQVRPYKGAWSKADALAELEHLGGTHFDPAVVAVAITVFSARAYDDELERGLGLTRVLPSLSSSH